MGTWQHWVNAVLGLAVIAVPFLFGVADASLMWTLVIAGLVIAVLGLWGGSESQSESSAQLVHSH